MMVIVAKGCTLFQFDISLIVIWPQIAAWDQGEWSRNTFLQVMLPLVQHSCRVFDWLPDSVHVMWDFDWILLGELDMIRK